MGLNPFHPSHDHSPFLLLENSKLLENEVPEKKNWASGGHRESLIDCEAGGTFHAGIIFPSSSISSQQHFR